MNDPGSPAGSGKPNRERRAVPRYNLIASVEIIDPLSGVRISGRISELGRQGCYIDALNTLPPNTLVTVRISRDRGTFASPAKIIYVQDRIGMGLSFLDLPADQLTILDSWLAELTA